MMLISGTAAGEVKAIPDPSSVTTEMMTAASTWGTALRLRPVAVAKRSGVAAKVQENLR